LALGTRGKVRWIILSVLLVVGLAGFGLRYRAYLAGGATSFAARLDYWQAAWSGTVARPVFGSGPGTFAGTYREFKRPEAEMTKLAHNDFLQQGADSGWMGLVTYAAWLLGGMGWLLVRVYRGKDVCRLGIALGLAGITMQGFLEFWLYIPALAWPAFFLLGLALAPEPGGLAGRNPIDKKNSPAPKSKPSVANVHH
jgi:O-antigen ligase